MMILNRFRNRSSDEFVSFFRPVYSYWFDVVVVVVRIAVFGFRAVVVVAQLVVQVVFFRALAARFRCLPFQVLLILLAVRALLLVLGFLRTTH